MGVGGGGGERERERGERATFQRMHLRVMIKLRREFYVPLFY